LIDGTHCAEAIWVPEFETEFVLTVFGPAEIVPEFGDSFAFAEGEFVVPGGGGAGGRRAKGWVWRGMRAGKDLGLGSGEFFGVGLGGFWSLVIWHSGIDLFLSFFFSKVRLSRLCLLPGATEESGGKRKAPKALLWDSGE
jgi:hypothetical protein